VITTEELTSREDTERARGGGRDAPGAPLPFSRWRVAGGLGRPDRPNHCGRRIRPVPQDERRRGPNAPPPRGRRAFGSPPALVLADASGVRSALGCRRAAPRPPRL